MVYFFNKVLFLLSSIFILSSCGFMTKKEYTVIREKARAVPVQQMSGQFLVPVYDANGQLIQQGKLVQKNGVPAYVQTDISANNSLLKGNTPLYVSPVSGEVIPSFGQQEVFAEGTQKQQTSILPTQPNVQIPIIPSEQTEKLYKKGEIVPNTQTYQGQVFPLSVNEIPPVVPPTQGQIQKEMGMPQTPMQANIIQSYTNCPYIVVLQHPEERNLVKCLMCDQLCLQRYEQAGYVQLRYIPQSSGSKDVPSMSDYPAGRWRENEEIPRW